MPHGILEKVTTNRFSHKSRIERSDRMPKEDDERAATLMATGKKSTQSVEERNINAVIFTMWLFGIIKIRGNNPYISVKPKRCLTVSENKTCIFIDWVERNANFYSPSSSSSLFGLLTHFVGFFLSLSQLTRSFLLIETPFHWFYTLVHVTCTKGMRVCSPHFATTIANWPRTEEKKTLCLCVYKRDRRRHQMRC